MNRQPRARLAPRCDRLGVRDGARQPVFRAEQGDEIYARVAQCQKVRIQVTLRPMADAGRVGQQRHALAAQAGEIFTQQPVQSDDHRFHSAPHGFIKLCGSYSETMKDQTETYLTRAQPYVILSATTSSRKSNRRDASQRA